uniref:Peroxin-19 n=1 Tax=Meloidogyne hapla TaxID=6305 RepID=A0A1I8BB48_MELHA
MTSASLRSAFFSSTSGQKVDDYEMQTLMGGDGARDNVPGGQDPENSGQNPPPPNVNIEQVNLSQLVQNVNENTNQLVQLFDEMSSQISKQPDTFKNLTTQFERFMEAITKLLKDPRVVSHINASETFNKTEG